MTPALILAIVARRSCDWEAHEVAVRALRRERLAREVASGAHRRRLGYWWWRGVMWEVGP